MEFGVWSLVPPVLTIALALTTKNVFISLLIGILTGNLVLNHFAVFTGLNAGIYSILDTMTESNTLIIGSVLITAAVIHLAEKSGGIEGFVNVVVKKQGLIKSKRGANLFTWLLGLVVFTSGTLSCMVTGSVARPVNDALKVPHEKAAFIVHTTSTPWCVLFPFSGWLAAMAGYRWCTGRSVCIRSVPVPVYELLLYPGDPSGSGTGINTERLWTNGEGRSQSSNNRRTG